MMIELRGKLSPGISIIGHRGASGHAPENTLTSFRLAADMGADAIEFDVQLTSDGEPVVFHDANLDRTTNGFGRLSSRTYEEIRRLDAGSFFGPEFSGEKIPHLEEVFNTISPLMTMNVELKSMIPDGNLVARTHELIDRCGITSNVLISSFNPLLLLKSYRRNPSISIGLLMPGEMNRLLRFMIQNIIPYDAFHPDLNLVSFELIRKQHQHGHAVNTWTVNQTTDMENFIEWGIDGLITNFPDRANRILNR